MHSASGAQAAPRGLEPSDELVLPRHRSMVTQYRDHPGGGRELRLFYGAREISFDEPELFAFGEMLGRTGRFRAADAAGLDPRAPWPRIRDLLEQLLDEGLLVRAGEAPSEDLPAGDRERPSPLPPATLDVPRSWDDCEAIIRELTGRPLELGHLELLIPIFRVAHMALDADGRQVGEANVFPPAMRLDTPTEWRTCTYPGARHQDERPMNLTALKTMRAYWSDMMAVLLEVRRAYLIRYPDARAGWTVGHLERLATAVLALPTLQLMRAERPVPNGALNPVLSSVFRVTDGLRMTMHQMLFVPFGEPTLSPDAPMTSAEVHAYAERNYTFHSERGVCAGPRIMVEEFLSVLIDGATPKGGLPSRLEPELERALGDIDAALDYGLLGLRAYAVIFSAWPAMTRAYEGLAAAMSGWSATGDPAAQPHLARFESHLARIRRAGFLSEESWRADRDAVYADMFARCGQGLRLADDTPLDVALAPRPAVEGDATETILRTLLAAGLATGPQGAPPQVLDRCVAEIMAFTLRIQAVLRQARQAQAAINRHLGRAPPTRTYDSRDLDLHNRLHSLKPDALPYLFDELAQLYGIEIVVTPHRIHVQPTAANG